MNEKMKGIVLAAGIGERMKPLTGNLPKPMLPIKDKPLLEYTLALFRKYEIRDIIITTFYLKEKITDYFKDGNEFGVSLTYLNEKELLPSSIALKRISDFIDDAAIIINGDNLTNINLWKVIESHKKNSADITIVSYLRDPSASPSSQLIFDEEFKLREYKERLTEEEMKKIKPSDRWANMGMYIFNKNVIESIPEDETNDIGKLFPFFLKNGFNIFVHKLEKDAYFKEIGKMERYIQAKEDIESSKIKLSLPLTNKSKTSKAVFLDKDGVINEILYEPDGNIMSPANLEQLKILPKVKEGISKLKDIGLKIIAISNQPGIAFGYLRVEKLKEINDYLKKELGIDEIYDCTHHPKYDSECKCRKPKPGLIEKAEKDLDIDVKNSYLVGDNLSDIQTGNNAKVKKTFRIGTLREDILELQHKKKIYPDYTMPNLVEIAEKIKEIEKGDIKMVMLEECDLKGMTILINGGSSGLGKKVSEFLLKKGCRVIITSSKKKKLDKAFEELKKDELSHFVCDITKSKDIDSLFNNLSGKKIDVLINCAGVLGPIGKFDENNFKRWKKTIDINLTGNAHLIYRLIPILLNSENPKVINFSGGGAAYSRPYHTAYASSKTAMVRLTEILADEYKGKIDFNIIAPGAHKTAMWKKETFEKEPKKWADINKLFDLISFLISSKSNGITGRFIHIENDWKNFTREISNTDRLQLRRTN